MSMTKALVMGVVQAVKAPCTTAVSVVSRELPSFAGIT